MAYPTSVATDADLYLAKNQLATQLDGSIDAIVTTITVDSTTGFPTVGFVTIDSEVIKYTGTTATQFTGCTRGADGTSATTHMDNAPVRHTVVAAHHNALKDEVIALTTHLIPGQHTGTATNDNAAAGKVGEYISASATPAVPASGTYGDVTSISLTAGDWDIYGSISFDRTGGGTWTLVQTGISINSGNTATGLTLGDTASRFQWSSNVVDVIQPTVLIRMSLSSTTTVYLKVRVDYTVGTPVINGSRISARRVR